MENDLFSAFMDRLHAATDKDAAAMLVYVYRIANNDWSVRFCCADKTISMHLTLSQLRRACKEGDEREIPPLAAVWRESAAIIPGELALMNREFAPLIASRVYGAEFRRLTPETAPVTLPPSN